MSMPATIGHSRHGQAGFTLLELTVVLGLLAAFTLFLIQILIGGVRLFDEGETGQALADRANVAADGVSAALDSMIGPERESFEPGPPDARLLVQWVPLALNTEKPLAVVQAVRATVALRPLDEEQLLARSLLPKAIATAATGGDEDVQARLEELLVQAPRTGRGAMLLLPWPAPGDPEGAFLDLRRGLFLPDAEVAVDKQRSVSLIEEPELTEGGITPELILQNSEPIVSNLLHVELALWSQNTRGWDGAASDGGPEWVWDSARAGWLAVHDDPRQRFSLDVGPASAENTADDVFPRWLRVTLVVAAQNAEARLADEINDAATELRVIDDQGLVDVEAGTLVKIGSEWLRVGAIDGRKVSGLKRAQRGTAARGHPLGARLWIGRTVVLTLRLPHGRDDWNG